MPETVWVVEDDMSIRELLLCALQSYNYAIEGFEHGEALLERIAQNTPDLILLDYMLPGLSGLEILKKLLHNKSTCHIPIIMLTAKGAESDKVSALDAGAHDYITKPFGVLELLARVRAALRPFTQSNKPTVLSFGDVSLDTARHTLTVNQKPVDLTLKEYELLKTLMQNKNRVMERTELLDIIWGYDFSGETRTLDVHIRALRQKLQDDAENPRYIQTVRGVGYKFEG